MKGRFTRSKISDIRLQDNKHKEEKNDVFKTLGSKQWIRGKVDTWHAERKYHCFYPLYHDDFSDVWSRISCIQ
ncbi:uncharacterized protein Dvar_41900 [Desulfosarcina variabilis str. Montpellier]